MNAHDAHKSILAGVTNPHITRRLAKVPTGAMERDGLEAYRQRIGCELVVLAVLIAVALGGCL